MSNQTSIQTSQDTFLLEGVLKKKESTRFGTKWIERFYQLSSNTLVEKPVSEYTSDNPKSFGCDHNSWDISSIGVIASSKNNFGLFVKDQASCVKIVFKNGEVLELLANDPQKWITQIKNIQKREINKFCAQQSISRITEFIKNSNLVQKKVDQGKVRLQLEEKFIPRIYDLISKSIPERSFSYHSSRKPSMSSKSSTDENLDGFNQICIVNTELQAKISTLDKQISECLLRREELRRKLGKLEKSIEEMKSVLNEKPDLLKKEQELLERERNLEEELKKLKSEQLETIACDTAYRKKQQEEQKMEKDNLIFEKLQRRKEQYISQQEQKLQHTSLDIEQRDRYIKREGGQLRQKIREYNQSVQQLNNQANVLDNTEKEVKSKTEELERLNNEISKKAILIG